MLQAQTERRQVKYLNNRGEQDHRNIKRIINPMMGLRAFNSARQMLRGIEAMNMIDTGQVQGANFHLQYLDPCFDWGEGDRGICPPILENLLEQQPTTDDRIADHQTTFDQFKFPFGAVVQK